MVDVVPGAVLRARNEPAPHGRHRLSVAGETPRLTAQELDHGLLATRLVGDVQRVGRDEQHRQRSVQVDETVALGKPQQELPVLRRGPRLVEAADLVERGPPDHEGARLDRHLLQQAEVHLARLEIAILVSEWLRRVPEWRIVVEAASRPPSSFQWGWNSVPVQVEV